MKKKTKAPWSVRQGDVLIIRLPAKAGAPVAQEPGRVVLAHGEATGHSHALLDDRASLYEIEDKTAVGDAIWSRLLRIAEKAGAPPAQVVHEEHGPHELEAGDYVVLLPRVYHPEELRVSRD